MNVILNNTPFPVNRAMLKSTGVTVKQSMSGRLRVRVKSLRSDSEKSGWMLEKLKKVAGVIAVESRFHTGSVIIHFNPEKLTIRFLLGEIVEQILHPIRTSAKVVTPVPSRVDCKTCDCDEDRVSFSNKLKRVVFLSGFMVYSLARMWIFRLPLIQTPLSILGVVSIIGTIPLLKEAITDTVEKKKLTVKPFLAAGSLFTIGMGEAFSALQILWIYNVAELTEDYVAQRSRQAIRNILEVAPANAYVLVDGMEVETAVADIKVDDVVVVHAGEKIPVDGLVEKGEAMVDEASINGRSEAIVHSQGDTVFAGTIVNQGILFVKTVKTGEDTYLSQIMRMVEDSMANKAPVEQKADQLASRLMKIGLTATALTFLLTGDPMRALTVMLVMSCPCATVLAASSAVTASLANAAKHSVLIKGGLYLERIGEADAYCLDKTGTLTSDQPHVLGVYTRTPFLSEDKVISMAATAESHNHHPMAQAILAEADKRGLSPEAHAVCDFKAGRGVECTTADKSIILVGNRKFMEENGVDVAWFNKKSTAQRAQGNTVVYVANDGKAQGMLGVANPIRPEALRVLNCLRRDGVKSMHLVTGDTEEVARTMMDVFPFDDCKAGLMPEEKAFHVEELQKTTPVVMVGDGVNDALALAKADIGVAMGAAGAEVAMEAADIALADSNLEGLVKVRNLSHQTMRVIDQNHYFAISTDLVGAVLGMLGILSPVMAGMIHIIHTGGILVNSSRLLSWEAPVLPIDGCGCSSRKCDHSDKTLFNEDNTLKVIKDFPEKVSI